jgi:hypothetical protein
MVEAQRLSLSSCELRSVRQRSAGSMARTIRCPNICELVELSVGEWVDDESANFVDVSGGGGDDLVPTVVGEDRQGVAAVGGVGSTADPVLLLKARYDLGEPGQGAFGEHGEVAHPKRALRRLRQCGEHLVLEVIDAVVTAELSVQGGKQPHSREGHRLARGPGCYRADPPRSPQHRAVLVPLAAVGLILLMTGAAITHARRRELQGILVNLVLLALAVVVVWGRFGPASFTA